MANYRHFQADFSAGQLSEFITNNPVHPMNQHGVALSHNMFHMPAGSVHTRPKSEVLATYAPILPINNETMTWPLDATIDNIKVPLIETFDEGFITPSETTHEIFFYGLMKDKLFFADSDGKGYKVADQAKFWGRSHFAAVNNLLIEANSYFQDIATGAESDVLFLAHEFKNVTYIEDASTYHADLETKAVTRKDLIGWKNEWRIPYTCSFIQGRLFLGRDDTVLASRTPDNGVIRWNDFSLADYKYKWVLERKFLGYSGTIQWNEESFKIYCSGEEVKTGPVYPKDDLWYEMHFKAQESEIDEPRPIYDCYIIIPSSFWQANNFDNLSREERVAIMNREMNFNFEFSHGIRTDNYQIVYLGDGGYEQLILDTAQFEKIEVKKNSEIVEKTVQRTFIYTFRVPRNAIESSPKPEYENDYYWLQVSIWEWNGSNYDDMTVRDRIAAHIGPHTSYDVWTNRSWDGGRALIPGTAFIQHGYEGDVTTVITTRYAGGSPTFTDVMVTDYNPETGESINLTKNIVEIGVLPLYDKTNKSLVYDAASKEEMPTVYPTHAIEIHENDMANSPVQWIANMNGVVVGTRDAIFISESNLITPQDFDLRPVSYTRSSKKQPKTFGPYLTFMSADDSRIYAAIPNIDTRGLVISDLTENMDDEFFDGYWNIIDYCFLYAPYQSICIRKVDCLWFGSLYFTENGQPRFSFSKWDLSDFAPISIFSEPDARGRDRLVLLHPAGAGNFFQPIFLKFDYQSPEEINDDYMFSALDFYHVRKNGKVVDGKLVISYFGDEDIIAPWIGIRNLYCVVHDNGKKYFMDGPGIYKGTGDSQDTNATLTFEFPAGVTPPTEPFSCYLGVKSTSELQLTFPLLPNNSGVSLISKYSIQSLVLKVLNSGPVELSYGDNKPFWTTLPIWGEDRYNKSKMRTGCSKVDMPLQHSSKPVGLKIKVDSDSYLCLQGVETKYNITEVN